MAEYVLFSILILSNVLFPAQSLECLHHCSITYVPTSQSIIPLPHKNKNCIQQTHASLCKGRIITTYGNESQLPISVTYMLGPAENENDYEYVDNMLTYGTTKIMRYQLKIDFKKRESFLIADIYCQDQNHCAWLFMKGLIEKYQYQPNPIGELENLVHSGSPSNPICFEAIRNENRMCPVTNSVCVSNSKNFEQGCVSNLTKVEIHEELLVPEPYTIELDQRSDLVYCNRDNCNNFQTLSEIQRISENYFFGNVERNEAFRFSEADILISICLWILFDIYSTKTIDLDSMSFSSEVKF